MFWAIVIALFVLWLLGVLLKLGGKLIHALLLIALIVIIVKLLFQYVF